MKLSILLNKLQVSLIFKRSKIHLLKENNKIITFLPMLMYLINKSIILLISIKISSIPTSNLRLLLSFTLTSLNHYYWTRLYLWVNCINWGWRRGWIVFLPKLLNNLSASVLMFSNDRQSTCM